MPKFELEALEVRQYLSIAVQSVDGTGNNVLNPTWGSAGIDLIRLAAAAYADGVSSPALPADQSARAISNILNSQADPSNPSQDIATIDENSLSDFGYAFGQFMDHDLDLTPDGGTSFPIAVAAGDPMGPNPIPFTRSATDPATGTSTSNPLQQVTNVTAYLDLSQVYGSNQTVADALRTFQGGLLKTSAGNMLPYDSSANFTPAQIAALNMANDSGAVSTDQLFAAGDRRANENIELTALQTLFLRNHNKIASELAQQDPSLTDEQLYQEARKLNIAEYQNIVYNEWIPAVYGAKAMTKYTGYNPNVNASIATEFSTVAFRFGHSMVSGGIERQDNTGQDVAPSVPLSLDFFDPNLLSSTGATDPLTGLPSTDIGAVLKGEADGNGQAMDLMAINDIRNLLFGNGGFGGEDLMARDVQRDRDNGIPDYNTLRVDLGLPAVTSFADITSNVQVQQELAAAYPGGVNTIDAFEGGLAEDHVAGSDVGQLFQAIMVNQFERLRDGDRFFYLNETFTKSEMKILQSGNTLAKTIEGNTDITNLQSDVMLFRASISGTVQAGHGPHGRGGSYVGGMVVQLENADGDVVATTITDSHGHYSFNQLSGPAADAGNGPGVSATGTYSVVLQLPTGATQISPNTSAITITRGDTNVRGMDFYVNLGAVGPTPHRWHHDPFGIDVQDSLDVVKDLQVSFM
jgi:peroxidase